MVYGDGITTRLTTGCVGFYVSKPRQSDTLREELVYCLLGHVSENEGPRWPTEHGVVGASWLAVEV